MSKIDVSVIVPVYNVEKYLQKCLDSLVNQDFNNYEIIVVNDGSPDNSQKIIDNYVVKYPNKIKAFKKSNGGVSDARNYGLERANGTYIMFVDSDDYVESNYISVLYKKIVENNYDIVICDMLLEYTNDTKTLYGLSNTNNTDLKNAIISMPAAWNKIYNRNLFVNNNIYYPEKIYYEDLATTPRLIVNAKKIGYVNEALYHYVQSENSIMRQAKYNPKGSDIFKSLNILTDYFKNNNYYTSFKEEIEYIYITHLLHDYSLRVFRYVEGINDIENVVKFMRDNYPNWQKNKYYKRESFKYKVVCRMIYSKKIKLLRKILK